MLSTTASFANNLIKQSWASCEQPEEAKTDLTKKVTIGNTLYDDFVAKQVKTRTDSLNLFEQNILFIREGLPQNQIVTPLALTEEVLEEEQEE